MSGIMNMFVAAKTTIATAVDAFFNSVSLLLNTSSTNGAQNNTFLDSSTNNFTITRNGNTTQGTFTPFSQTGWSNYLQGSSSGFSFTGINIGTSQFTFEGWIYVPSFSTIQHMYGSAATNDISVEISNATTIVIDQSGVGSQSFTVASMSTNAWHHIAVVRNSSVMTVFVDGVRSTTGALSNTVTYNNFVYIGYKSSGFPLIGYASNFRVVKSAVYDPTQSTITVPTTPLTSIANTVLLTCQSNRFVDNGPNAVSLTPTNSPTVQAFSPFLPTAAYDAAVVGGSAYFDGTSDYLTCASSANLAVGTGDFTYEFWLYPHAANSDNCIFDTRAANNNTSGFAFLIRSSANLEIYTNTANLVCNGAIKQSMWQHVALVRSGSTVTAYVNGVSAGSATFSNNLTDQTLSIASYVGAGSSISAYISGFRLVKGTAVYTATFTPPTSPATAITNTQLLLLGTNAGIFDSAAKNVLETVGNAQVSTTQAKWGTTSMYFDGTGDCLILPASPNFLFNGDFTIEGWFNRDNGADGSIFVMETSGSNYFALNVASTGYSVYLNNTGPNFSPAVTLSNNTWYYVALVRSGSTITLYHNGTSVGTATNSSALGSASVVGYVGGINGGLKAYIDDFRFTKYARYTANFTAPTAAFPLQ